MWVVSVENATLSDYMAMMDFMQREFVTEAFTVFSQSSKRMQMCSLIHEDEEVDVKSWFSKYVVDYFDDRAAELDQPLTIEACMLLSMSEADLIHTKNLRNTRSRLCDRLGITLPALSVVVEP